MKKAFSFIEIAVVLIVIAILSLIFIMGSKILEGSRMQTVITTLRYYEGAFVAFDIKYDAAPGDFKDADATFGTSNKNGNYNHQIELDTGDINAGDEERWCWTHLGKAKLISGDYTGYGAGVIGENMPKLNGWDNAGFRCGKSKTQQFNIGIAGVDSAYVGRQYLVYPAFTAREAFKIDKGSVEIS